MFSPGWWVRQTLSWPPAAPQDPCSVLGQGTHDVWRKNFQQWFAYLQCWQKSHNRENSRFADGSIQRQFWFQDPRALQDNLMRDCPLGCGGVLTGQQLQTSIFFIHCTQGLAIGTLQLNAAWRRHQLWECSGDSRIEADAKWVQLLWKFEWQLIFIGLGDSMQTSHKSLFRTSWSMYCEFEVVLAASYLRKSWNWWFDFGAWAAAPVGCPEAEWLRCQGADRSTLWYHGEPGARWEAEIEGDS